MIIGILASFIGASLQATNYAVTQRCQQKHNLGGVNLLVAVHIAMGVMAFCLSLFLGYLPLFQLGQWLDFLKINLPYILAQYALISAIHRSDSSVVSPLLALKVPVLALITFYLTGAGFSTLQCVSIAIIIAIAFYFSSLSGKLHLQPLVLILLASIGYSLSDMAITEFSHQVIDANSITQAVATICLNYTVCGVCGLVLMRPFKVRIVDVYHSKWVALTWFVGVIFLILGFNLAGVVSGNVVQTLRGVIGVLIAYIWFRHQIAQPASIWRKKFIASGAMVIAVFIYYV